MGSPTLLQTILMALFIFFPLSLFLLFFPTFSLSLSLLSFFAFLFLTYIASISVSNYCMNVFFLPLNCNK